MKILQIGKFYPIEGGVEKVMFDLMHGLSSRGIYCDMLCSSGKKHKSGVIRLNSCGQVLCMPTMLKLAATTLSPTMIFRLRKICKEYDIIHIHHPDPMACLALFLSGYDGPVILHWHSDILKQKTLLKLYQPLQEWLIRRAVIVVGTTPVYVRESPFLQNIQHKIYSLPIGVDEVIPDFEQARQIRSRYSGKKIVFSLGRLVQYKGYEYLIRAAEKLSDDCVILIGGKGPLDDELHQLIQKLGLARKVRLLGFVSDEELPAYFTACELFCMPSIMKTEAFGIAQVEAMSCGKPVVSADIPESGVSWVNQEGVSGLVVPPADPEQLSCALNRLLSDRQLYERLAAGARGRYEELFTKDRMIDCCLNIYRFIMEDKTEKTDDDGTKDYSKCALF